MVRPRRYTIQAEWENISVQTEKLTGCLNENVTECKGLTTNLYIWPYTNLYIYFLGLFYSALMLDAVYPKIKVDTKVMHQPEVLTVLLYCLSKLPMMISEEYQRDKAKDTDQVSDSTSQEKCSGNDNAIVGKFLLLGGLWKMVLNGMQKGQGIE